MARTVNARLISSCHAEVTGAVQKLTSFWNRYTGREMDITLLRFAVYGGTDYGATISFASITMSVSPSAHRLA